MYTKIIFNQFNYKRNNFTLTKEIIFEKCNLLIGHNGSGKSTVINSLSSVVSDFDKIKIYANDKKIDDPFRYAVDNIYIVTDNPVFKSKYIKLCKIFENKEIKKEDIKLLGLNKFENNCVLELSLGNRQKLAILLALHSNKKIILLDEATNGIDKMSITIICDMLINSNKQIIFATHDTEVIERLGKCGTITKFD